MTIDELRRGVELIRHPGDTIQAAQLDKWLGALILQHGDRLLPLDSDVAQLWGRLRVPHHEDARVGPAHEYDDIRPRYGHSGPAASIHRLDGVHELSRFLGITIAMYYRDHAPSHFHAIYGEFEVTVAIATGQVAGEMPARALAHVQKWQARQPLPSIAPLE